MRKAVTPKFKRLEQSHAHASCLGNLPKKSLWASATQVQLTVCGYTMICLLYNLMDEVIPIFGSAARQDGGLGMSTSALALPLALGGCSIFV